MATLEMQRPQRAAPIPSRRSPPLSSASLTPSSPTIIRTSEFILLPSVPTHEPEDNLPSPRVLQHQFALAAQSDAEARRSRQNSLRQSFSYNQGGAGPRPHSELSHHSGSSGMLDNDELEEIVEPETAFEWDPAARQDALRDVRNQQLDSLQAIVHSLAEAHFDGASSSSPSNSVITQILDDMFASLRRIGGHNAPLSPTFAVPAATSLGIHQISDVDRLVLLVDKLSLAVGSVTDAKQAGLLANLETLTQGLIESDRRMARAALESPPPTPRTLNRPDPSFRRRSSMQQQQQQQQSQHSPQSSVHLSGSPGSWSSFGSYATFSTSSDGAALSSSADVKQKDATKIHELSSTKAKRSDVLAEAGLLSSVPEQQKVDGSVFDMATVRQPSKTVTPATFSIETLYARQSSAPGVVAPLSPRSDQASRAASVGERSDSTALPNRKRFSVQTDSAASSALPSYSCDVPGYDDVSSPSHDNKPAILSSETSRSEELPRYDGPAAEVGFSADHKLPLETPTLLERRRAKLAAQHSAYAARTPEDLAMVQSSIDRLSTVMPQLDNQRALSPEQQREAQLHQMMARLSASNAKRLDDQRSDPPRLRAVRPAPLPRIETTCAPALLPKCGETRELSKPAMTGAANVLVAEPEVETPATPTTPAFAHSASTPLRRASLLPGAFGRKLSIASIGNALRRASIYDATKVKSKDSADQIGDGAGASAPDTKGCPAPAQRSRAKSDIAEGLTSLFNDSRPRKNSAADASRARLAAQTGFRAIDFADDTPRGRDTSLMPRASEEGEEADSMLDDYSFATFDTTASNHRMSLVPDSPHSPVSWISSSGSYMSSRRSSQLLSSHPATPTWPKSPLTPVSPAASKKTSKTLVTFAVDTLQPPPSGRSRAASLQSQLRDNGLSRLHPRKCPVVHPPASAIACDPVGAFASAPAAVSTATVPAGSGHNNDLVVYTACSTTNTAAATVVADEGRETLSGSSCSQSNTADTSMRPVSATATTRQHQSEVLPRKVELEFFAEAQHTLGSISVLLWSNTQAASVGGTVELTYQLVEEDVTEQQSRTLHIAAVDGKDVFELGLACAPREGIANVETSSSDTGSGSGSGRGEKRKQGSDHVRQSRSVEGVRIHLPAAATFAQSGRVTLSLPTMAGAKGAVCRLKLALTDAERRAGAEESRAEGMVEFPLSAASLSSTQAVVLACAVCVKHRQDQGQNKTTVVEVRDGMKWRALPSEGWEELVDAWMCHGDQELNRSLTETAVKFSSKVQTGSYAGQSGGRNEIEGKKQDETAWVGDTYLLVPQSLLAPSNLVVDQQQDGSMQTILRCKTCRSAMGEVSSTTAANASTTTVKLTKYLLEPMYASASPTHGKRTWVATLLSTLQYCAASHGARRFLLHPASNQLVGMEIWLFSRARFTTTVSRLWSTLHDGESGQEHAVWKGSRVFYRAPGSGDSTDAVERVEIPDPVYDWTAEAMEQCNASLPIELSHVLAGWNGAYLSCTVTN